MKVATTKSLVTLIYNPSDVDTLPLRIEVNFELTVAADN